MPMKFKLIAGLALLAFGSSVQAATIDFESFGGGTSYSTQGVTFTADGQYISPQTAPNGTIGILADGSPRAEITAVFDALTDFVSIDLGDYNADADTLFLEAFDASHSLIGSTSLLTLESDTSMHTLSLSLSNIASVRFGARAPALSGNSVYADNLTFNSGGAVPEPATWAMMLLGFGAIGFQMRSRRTRGAALTA